MPGRLASFAFGLAQKTGHTPGYIRWRMYLPEALQYLHCALVAEGAWVIPPRPHASAQLAQLVRPPAFDPLVEL